MKNDFLQSDRYRKIEARYHALKAELAALGWLSDGSVVPNHPGHWRWTRKVKAKTVGLSLSPHQADLFKAAIKNHRRLESILREMRSISQEVLLNSAESVRKKPRQKHPKSTLT